MNSALNLKGTANKRKKMFKTKKTNKTNKNGECRQVVEQIEFFKKFLYHHKNAKRTTLKIQINEV